MSTPTDFASLSTLFRETVDRAVFRLNSRLSFDERIEFSTRNPLS